MNRAMLRPVACVRPLLLSLAMVVGAIVVGWQVAKDPALGYTLTAFGGLLLLGLVNFPIMAALSLLAILILPEGDLLLALGFGLPMAGPKLNLIDGLLFANLFVFGLHLITGRLSFEWTRLGRWLMGLLVVSMVAFARGVVLFGPKPAFVDVRTFLFFSTFFIALSLLRSEDDLRLAVRLFIAGLLGHALFILFISSFMNALISPELYKQLFDYDNTSGRLAFSNSGLIPMVAPILIVFRHQLTRLVPKAFFWPCMALMLLPVALSMSRSIIALLGGTLLVSHLASIRHDRQAFVRALKGGSGIGATLMAIIVVSPYLPVLGTIFARFHWTSIVESAMGRILSSLFAYQSFLAHPLLGTGFGSQLGLVWITGEMTEKYFVDDAWATVLAKLGIVGGITLAGVLVAALQTGREAFERGSMTVRDVLMALAAAIPFAFVSFTLLSAHLVHSRVIVTAFCLGLAVICRYCDLKGRVGHA